MQELFPIIIEIVKALHKMRPAKEAELSSKFGNACRRWANRTLYLTLPFIVIVVLMGMWHAFISPLTKGEINFAIILTLPVMVLPTISFFMRLLPTIQMMRNFDADFLRSHIREIEHDQVHIEKLQSFPKIALEEVKKIIEVKANGIHSRISLFFGSPDKIAVVTALAFGLSSFKLLDGKLGFWTSPGLMTWEQALGFFLTMILAVITGFAIGAFVLKIRHQYYMYQVCLINFALSRKPTTGPELRSNKLIKHRFVFDGKPDSLENAGNESIERENPRGTFEARVDKVQSVKEVANDQTNSGTAARKKIRNGVFLALFLPPYCWLIYRGAVAALEREVMGYFLSWAAILYICFTIFRVFQQYNLLSRMIQPISAREIKKMKFGAEICSVVALLGFTSAFFRIGTEMDLVNTPAHHAHWAAVVRVFNENPQKKACQKTSDIRDRCQKISNSLDMLHTAIQNDDPYAMKMEERTLEISFSNSYDIWGIVVVNNMIANLQKLKNDEENTARALNTFVPFASFAFAALSLSRKVAIAAFEAYGKEGQPFRLRQVCVKLGSALRGLFQKIRVRKIFRIFRKRK